MSNNPKLATEQQVQDVSNTFAELFNHQGKQIKALESGVIDAIEPSSPAPTKRGEYKVTKVGVYINFKDGNGQPISVTEEDYSSGNVSIIYNGTDNRKLVVPITFEGEVKEGDTRGVNGNEVNSKLNEFTQKDNNNITCFGKYVENLAIFHNQDNSGTIVYQDQAVCFIIPVTKNSEYIIDKEPSNRFRLALFDTSNEPTVGDVSDQLFINDDFISTTIKTNNNNKWLVIYLSNNNKETRLTVIEKNGKIVVKTTSLEKDVVIKNKYVVQNIKKEFSVADYLFNQNDDGSVVPSKSMTISSLIPINSTSTILIKSEIPFLKTIRVYSSPDFLPSNYLGKVSNDLTLTKDFTFDLSDFKNGSEFLYISLILKSVNVQEDISDSVEIIEDKIDYIDTTSGLIPVKNDKGYISSDFNFEEGTSYIYNNGDMVNNPYTKSTLIDVSSISSIDFPVMLTSSSNGVCFFDSKMQYLTGYISKTPLKQLGNYGDRMVVSKPDNAMFFGFTYATDKYALDNNHPLFDYIILYKNDNIIDTRNNNIINKNKLSFFNTLLKDKSNFSVSKSNLINSIQIPIDDKYKLFEEAIEKLGHTITKEEIGKSYGDEYPIFGYTITPEKGYENTIALTGHVHGDEKLSPLGFIDSISYILSRNDTYNVALATKTRYIVVFIVNPYGYVNNKRYTKNNVNLNRNNDYRWELNSSDEHQYKGSGPNSEPETKSCKIFFDKFKGEIDYHLDLHDMVANIAYAPANNKLFKYTDEMNSLREVLEKINDVPKSTLVPYINEMGSFGNYFNEILGVTSITLESSRTFWDNKGINEKTKVAKCTELVLSYLHLFFYLNISKQKNTMYIEDVMSTAFRSEEHGINTWNKDILISEFSKYAKKEGNLFLLSNGNKSKNILVISGLSNDDLNSDLTSLRCIQKITNAENSGYISSITTKANLFFMPYANIDEIDSIVNNNIITDVIIINGFPNNSTKYNKVSAKYIGYKSKWLDDNVLKNKEEFNSLEERYKEKMISIYINNQVLDASRYGYCVAEWVNVIGNVISSLVFM